MPPSVLKDEIPRVADFMLSSDQAEYRADLFRMAHKFRHAFLLQKVYENKLLTCRQLKELLKYERTDNLPRCVVEGQRQVAETFKVSVRTVQYWLTQGMPRHPGGTYNLLEIWGWYIFNIGKGAGNQLEWEKRLWETQNGQANLLLNEVMRQRRIEIFQMRTEARKKQIAFISKIKKALLDLAKEITPQLVGLDQTSMQSLLEKRIDQIANDLFSQWTTPLPK